VPGARGWCGESLSVRDHPSPTILHRARRWRTVFLPARVSFWNLCARRINAPQLVVGGGRCAASMTDNLESNPPQERPDATLKELEAAAHPLALLLPFCLALLAVPSSKVGRGSQSRAGRPRRRACPGGPPLPPEMSPLVGVLEKGHDAHLPTELDAFRREDAGQKRASPQRCGGCGRKCAVWGLQIWAPSSTQSFPTRSCSTMRHRNVSAPTSSWRAVL
jgi:hypothetical protein